MPKHKSLKILPGSIKLCLNCRKNLHLKQIFNLQLLLDNPEKTLPFFSGCGELYEKIAFFLIKISEWT